MSDVTAVAGDRNAGSSRLREPLPFRIAVTWTSLVVGLQPERRPAGGDPVEPEPGPPEPAPRWSMVVPKMDRPSRY